MKKFIFSEKIDFGELKRLEEESKLSECVSQIMSELGISQEELAIKAKVPRCSVRRTLNYKQDCCMSNGLSILWYLHKELLAKGLPSPFHFDSSDLPTKS